MSNKGKRYGVCENFEKCNKAKAGEKIELDELDDFICPECHSDLREVQPVKGTNWKLIGGVAALVILGGGAATYFALSPTQPELEGLSLSISAQELFKGDIDTLKVTTTPIDCPATYIWTSSDEKVAKVDANGVVTMTGEGQATVIVTAVENAAAKDSCVYTVKGTFEIINVESMTFMETEKDMQLKAGEEKQLNIDCTPGNADEMVSWRSENVSIATVENDGIVKAVAPGITTITAVTDRSGSSASIKVTVTKEIGIKEGGTGKVDTGTQKLDLGFAIYEGSVIKGKPEGNGTMTFKKKCIIPGAKDDIEAQAGEYAIGRWHNGKVNVVTLYQKNGNQVTILSK